MNIEKFLNPEMLWLALLIAPMTAYYIFRTRQGDRATISISTVDGVQGVPRSAKYYLRHAPFVLKCLAVVMIVVAMARPQNSEVDTTSTTEGIDIVLSLDISGSMLARDFQPDRITVAKDMAAGFIMDRSHDRVGLVVFAGESFTQCPLTTDRATLLSLLGGVHIGMVEDGTAIGNGLATAVNRLRESQAKSKVIILLTDGVNNRGQIAPSTAAQLARSYGIRVYTIGVGSEGMALTPVYDRFMQLQFQPRPVEIDEDLLRNIASLTEGKYFRATDNKRLKEVYDEINTLETSRVEVEDLMRYNELYLPFALAALALLLVEFLIKRLYLRSIP